TYLKGALQGKAEKLLNPIKICDSNYAVALGLLKKRFDVKREIVGAHLRQILELKTLDGSGVALIDFVDNVNRALESLKAQSRPQDNDFLYLFLVQKLDSALRREWEKTLKSDDMPTVKDLMEFLEKEAWVFLAAG
ncbi:unnamed protein product, partial [Allacma fusca]